MSRYSRERGAGSKELRTGGWVMNEGFRFQRLDIWKRGMEISKVLFSWGDDLEKQRLFRFAEQLRGATLSITNNIAEGSGSCSKAEFANFLNMSRRSIFEVANILFMMRGNGFLPEGDGAIEKELEELSRMIGAFRNTLLRR